MILMQGDFFQVLRRVQREERSKSSLARVDNDFYKHLRDYIKDLERSVAVNPFGNEQLLLNNAQRIATEICELRESKITKAANNNIYRSFLLFKKDNPQFDLLDTTPLNLTIEEETLYFSLMDALKNHRYRISLDEYVEETDIEDEEEDFDEDEETTFVEDSYEESVRESETNVSDELEDEISDALGESDEVLGRLDQIKDAKVVTDEKYEHIDKQVASQKYPGQGTAEAIPESEEVQEAIEEPKQEIQDTPQDEVQEPKEDIQSTTEDSSKPKSFGTGNVNDIFKDPDSQFVDLDNLEPDYDDDFYNRIAAGSSYAAPTEDDFNMIFAKPKKPKSNEDSIEKSQSTDEVKPESSQFNNEVESSESTDEVKPEIPQSSQSELGFSSGLDVKTRKTSHTDAFDKAIQKLKEDNAPKKVVDKTRGGLFARDEIENATVVIKENLGELIGIDGKVYGPFVENDIVILPNITAQILIDNNKASLVKL